MRSVMDAIGRPLSKRFFMRSGIIVHAPIGLPCGRKCLGSFRQRMGFVNARRYGVAFFARLAHNAAVSRVLNLNRKAVNTP
jgi:hypothetical protein